MSVVSLILGSHCHLPVGLAEAEYEQAYHERLAPLLSALYRYPQVPAVLHYSGPLLYWIEPRKPEFFDLIRDMLKRKQVELLGGGFYEPAVALITPQDRTGQIEMLSTYLRKHFGQHCKGAYVSPDSWDPGIIPALKNGSIAYTFLPERFFVEAGIKSGEINFPVVTENQGQLLMVFPVLPFAAGKGMTEADMAKALFSLVKRRGTSGGGVYTVFLDRFSDRDVQERESILNVSDVSAFFDDVLSRAAHEDIKLTIPARLKETGVYQERRRSAKKIYFTNGYKRHFLVECIAANLLYAKMIDTRTLIQQTRGDKERKKAALNEIYRAQSYNLYSADVDYNITNPALRRAAYSALLGAERIIREAKKTTNKSLSSFDYDFDGNIEDVFRSDKLNCLVHRKGGRVFGLDYLPKCWNYIDTFSGYSFVETLYPADTFVKPAAPSDSDTPAAVSGGTVIKAFDAAAVNARHLGAEWWEEYETDRTRLKLALRTAEPADSTVEAPFKQIVIEKSYQLKKDSLAVHYTIYNRGNTEQSFIFTTELYLAFAGNEEQNLRIFTLDGETRFPLAGNDLLVSDIDGYLFQDITNEAAVTFKSDKRFSAILGESSEFGCYQATPVRAIVPVTLREGQKTAREFRLAITH